RSTPTRSNNRSLIGRITSQHRRATAGWWSGWSTTRRSCASSRRSSPGLPGRRRPSGRARRTPTPTTSRTTRWPATRQPAAALSLPDATPTQRAALKFMAVAALLFLGQTLIGGGVAHYRAEPGDFYGFDLSRLFPSNL